MSDRISCSRFPLQTPLFLGLLMSATVAAHAQSPTDAKWQLKVLGGLNSSTLSFDGPERPVNQSSRRGFALGVELGRQLGNQWSWSVGLNIAERGTRWDFTDFGPAPEPFKVRSQHIDIPVLLTRSVLKRRAFELGLVGGTILSTNGTGQLIQESTNLQFAVFDYQQFDVAATIGAQTILLNTRFPAFARIQYQYGLRSLTREQPSASNRSLAVLLGLSLKRW